MMTETDFLRAINEAEELSVSEIEAVEIFDEDVVEELDFEEETWR